MGGFASQNVNHFWGKFTMAARDKKFQFRAQKFRAQNFRLNSFQSIQFRLNHCRAQNFRLNFRLNSFQSSKFQAEFISAHKISDFCNEIII